MFIDALRLFTTAGFCAVCKRLPLSASSSINVEAKLSAKDNGMNAVFGNSVHCVAAEPNACFVRVSVTDGQQEIAYETAVLGRLRPGYRVLQLRGAYGTRIECAYLFLRISFTSEVNQWGTSRHKEKQLREMREAHVMWSKRIEGLEAFVGESLSRSKSTTSLLSSEVLAFDGFYESAARLVFSYGNNLVHLAEQTPPQVATIMATGEVSGMPTLLHLGGTWTRAELAGKSDEELDQLGESHHMQVSDRDSLIQALVGKDRAPELEDHALATFPMLQTMPSAAASTHLAKAPNSNFVWQRDDASIAVVHCWKV
eukprot:6239557-Prymnesium_polylepis.1